MTSSPHDTWFIRAITPPNFQWAALHHRRIHDCPHCHIPLLTGEQPGFCCGNRGIRLHDVPPFPPLPDEFCVFIDDSRLSTLSHIFNLIFLFASLESTAQFPSFTGPPGFFAVQGQLYHQVCPTHQNSAVRWLLYDGFLSEFAPHQNWLNHIPSTCIDVMRHALLCLNPFVQSIHQLSLLQPTAYPEACVIVCDQGSSPEVLITFTSILFNN
jgi:hypothetical protein